MTDIDLQRLQARAVAWKGRLDWAGEPEEMLGCPDWPADFGPEPAPDAYGALVVPAPMGSGNEPLPTNIALGDCALRLTSDGARGFLVYGPSAPASTAAELRVVAEGYNRLIVQVADPTAVRESAAAAGKSWIHAPHVEIWTAGETMGPDDLPAKTYRQIGVNLDGTVHPGVGNPALPSATRWTSSDEAGRIVTLLSLVWPEEYALLDGVGVVYSQSEGGRQARLVSSAGIAKNKPLFLPSVWAHEREEGAAGCAIRSGLLTIAP